MTVRIAIETAISTMPTMGCAGHAELFMAAARLLS